MDRESFWHLIADDPIFVVVNGSPQRPIKYQLATFLCRAGSEGILKTAAVMAVAEGTVFLYTECITTAFRNLRGRYLIWPNKIRCEFLSHEMNRWGFPGCIGIGDGSYIRLEEKPLQNRYAFYCHKKFYAAICEHRAIFMAYDFGWPGCVQDSWAFKNSHLWCHRTQYFDEHEYILVDKGKLYANLLC
ncbi:hypothetical protein BDR04DRAFT_1211878 [Suillus decipiens]|nr:hypothetical protein BDR04DRAFT_1211878 [Suillus decipiens]